MYVAVDSEASNLPVNKTLEFSSKYIHLLFTSLKFLYSCSGMHK